MRPRRVFLLRALLVLALASLPVAVQAVAAQPTTIDVALSVSPERPVVGQPASVLLQIVPQGPLNLMLLQSYDLVATQADGDQTLTATATPSPMDTIAYTATLTVPAAGTWHVTAPAWASAPGDALDVVVAGAAPGRDDMRDDR